MKIFKENKTIDFKFDFVSLSIANLSFIILSFFALNIPKKEKGILFAFEEKPLTSTFVRDTLNSYEKFQNPQEEKISNYIRFSINDKGVFFVEDEPISFNQVVDKLKNYFVEDSTKSIYIVIHENASYEYLIKAFDMTIQVFRDLKLSPKIFIGVIRR